MTVRDDGFSLIEALVALAVLAIATVGLVGAVEGHIDSTRGLERRAAATWVAENRLAELALGAHLTDDAAMLGMPWRVRQTLTATPDPEIARVRVTVSDAASDAPVATLDGFLDRPAGPR